MLFSCPTCGNDFYIKVTVSGGEGCLHLLCSNCFFKHDYAFPVTQNVTKQDLFLAAAVLMSNGPSLLKGEKSIDTLSLSPYNRVVKLIPWPFH